MSGKRRSSKRETGGAATAAACWCMASYGDSAAPSEVDKIMLRFRPIAPRPVAATAVHLAGDAIHAAMHLPMQERKMCGGGGGLGRRRRCAAAAGGAGLLEPGKAAAAERGRRRKAPAPDHPVSVVQAIDQQLEKWVVASVGYGSLAAAGHAAAEPSTVATLPLMPESPGTGKAGQLLTASPSPLQTDSISAAPTYPKIQEDDFSRYYTSPRRLHIDEELQYHLPASPLASTVLVVDSASAAEASVDAGMWLCCCDEEQARWGLHADASPAFLSDAFGRKVTWANTAYLDLLQSAAGFGTAKRFHAQSTSSIPNLVSMRWTPNTSAPPPTVGSSVFSCRVTVKQVSASLTAPCDVWRLADGAMAWRLDVDAALSLRR